MKKKYTKDDLWQWIIARWEYKQSVYREVFDYANKKWGKKEKK